MCTCGYMCMCVCMCGEAEFMLGVFLDHSLPCCFLRQGLSLKMEVISLARLVVSGLQRPACFHSLRAGVMDLNPSTCSPLF